MLRRAFHRFTDVPAQAGKPSWSAARRMLTNDASRG
jgi:hypothetical protein